MTTSRRKFVKTGLLAALFAGICVDAQPKVFGQQGNSQGGSVGSSAVPDYGATARPSSRRGPRGQPGGNGSCEINHNGCYTGRHRGRRWTCAAVALPPKRCHSPSERRNPPLLAPSGPRCSLLAILRATEVAHGVAGVQRCWIDFTNVDGTTQRGETFLMVR